MGVGLVLLLAGCGSDDDDPGSASGPDGGLEEACESGHSLAAVNAYLTGRSSRPDVADLNDRIAALDGVEEVDFVSREEALKALEERFDDGEITDQLPGAINPLPDSFSIVAGDVDAVELADRVRSLMPAPGGLAVDEVANSRDKRNEFCAKVEALGG